MQIVCQAVKKVIHFPAVDSTNNQAKRIGPTIQDEQLPVLITCGRQKAGRGRNQNSWQSNKGSITLSLVCQPKSRDSENSPSVIPFHWLSLWSAVCVHKTIAHFVPEFQPKLKWPNDLLVNGKKNSGILIESILGSPNRYVIGIGINVNNEPDTLEDSDQRFSWKESGREFLVTEVIDYLVTRLVDWDFFTKQAQTRLLQYWAENDFFENSKLELRIPDPDFPEGIVVSGEYAGLSEDGLIQLETINGKEAFATCHHVRKIS